PLDLLLYLIRNQKIGIADVRIAEIIDQFLSYVSTLQHSLSDKPEQLDSVGDFLVMAATLIQIKTRELLPVEETEEEDEESMTKEELIRLLQEYERFKDLAAQLDAKRKERELIFIRSTPIIEPSQEELLKVDLTKLLSAFSNVLKRASEETVREIARASVTIDECMRKIRDRLERTDLVLFEELFDDVTDKDTVISMFLAILELLKLGQILVSQQDNFGPIRVMRPPETDGSYSIEEGVPESAPELELVIQPEEVKAESAPEFGNEIETEESNVESAPELELAIQPEEVKAETAPEFENEIETEESNVESAPELELEIEAVEPNDEIAPEIEDEIETEEVKAESAPELEAEIEPEESKPESVVAPVPSQNIEDFD
ncbi:MAG: segregation/condensation protein A, partial [Candidatus Lindowbacteria bacterium]|nr:segregation/condensation protein A [Candidatus Lindowbacteria bacterium]